jgi:hypothetical protein
VSAEQPAVGRFLALEDTARIDADLAIPDQVARAIAHQSANLNKLALKIDRGKQMTCRQRHERHSTIKEKRVGTDE